MGRAVASRASDGPLARLLRERRRRLESLYVIKDERGKCVPFRLNWAQRALVDELHEMNVILKARQLGFTTLIQLIMLDACLFNDNTAAGTIAHRLEDATEIFNDKIKFAYDRLPEWIKRDVPAVQDSARKLSFANGSYIRVDTSLRSGTFQLLHVSEHGKLCAKYPDKAEEVRTGALNAVHAGQVVFIESTAEGREGDFYEICRKARDLARLGRTLTPLDFRFHFFPWWRHPGYRLAPKGVIVGAEQARYFEQLEAGHGIALEPEQKAWYVKKLATQGEAMKREFPSTPDEAFEAAIEGAYYAHEMARLRQGGQITRVPYEPDVKVNTFWDLGIDDHTAIWFHQKVGKEHRFVDYYEAAGEGLAHYAKVLQQKPYRYGRHYLPHDVEARSLSTGKSRKETLTGLGVRPIEVVRRADDIADAIQAVRNVLPKCWLDEAACAEGLKALDQYRREWDERLGAFKSRPRHGPSQSAGARCRRAGTGRCRTTAGGSCEAEERIRDLRLTGEVGLTGLSFCSC